jgi:hypothetical protein
MKNENWKPDARHSEFWEGLTSFIFLLGVIYIIIALILDYFDVF